MGKVLRPELCVIGAGPGGFTAAATAARSGAPVILVANERLDGPWRSAGSAAAAALRAAGAHVRAVRDTSFLGIGSGKSRINHPRVHAHVQRVVAGAAAAESPYRLAALGVQVVNEEPRFVDPRNLSVGDLTIAARRFLIATGSEPIIPDIPGLADVEVLTDDSILDTTYNPERLIVVGAGRTGLTLAQAQRRLGADVVVIDHGPALRREDPEIAAFATAALRREGIIIHEHTTIRQVAKAGDLVRVEIEGEDGPKMIEATHICVAVGRRPILEGLDLAAAGVVVDRAGTVAADRARTRNGRIYALSTVAGGDADSHFAAQLAKDEARRLVGRLLHVPVPRPHAQHPHSARALRGERARRSRSHRRGGGESRRLPERTHSRLRHRRPRRGRSHHALGACHRPEADDRTIRAHGHPGLDLFGQLARGCAQLFCGRDPQPLAPGARGHFAPLRVGRRPWRPIDLSRRVRRAPGARAQPPRHRAGVFCSGCRHGSSS